MKRITLLQIINLLSLVTIISITTISTTAQMSIKQTLRTNTDTVRRTYLLESFTAQVQPEVNDQKFILSISNPFGEQLNISVTGNGSSGFSDTTSELTYQKRINMRNAEDGNYTLSVYNDKKTITRTITITSTEYNQNLTLQ